MTKVSIFLRAALFFCSSLDQFSLGEGVFFVTPILKA